jgi:hypothetical protein
MTIHVCLELDVKKNSEVVQGQDRQACVEVCVGDGCSDARVTVPPIRAEDNEGFDVGNQALGNLHARVRLSACQPPNWLQLTFKHGSTAAAV